MIDVERRGDIALLTLAHGKANAFDAELCDAISERIAECEAPWCRAVVITGRGTIFSAGVDLLRVVNEGRSYARRFLPSLSRAFETTFLLAKPVVAAVNGHAIAGGCILACAADRRLMARGPGRIGVPELLVGVAFPPVPLEIVRFAVPQPHAAGLVFSGTTLDADRAAEVGLVDRAVEADALAAEALAEAERLAALPPEAFALAKRQLRAPAIARMQDRRRELDAAAEAVWSAPETLETMRAYIARTFKKPGG
jgi:enoyl-CoA hydratase